MTAGDIATAIEHYMIALRVAPGDAEVACRLGIALYHDGRLAEAKSSLEDAIEIDPGMAEAHNGLGAVAQFGERFDEALEHHRRAVELDPDFMEARANVGKILEDQGRTLEATEAYRNANVLRRDAVLELHAELLCPPIFASVEALDAYRDNVRSVIEGFAGQELRLDPDRVQSSKSEPPFDWAYHGRDNLDLKVRHAELFASNFKSEPLDHTPSRDGPLHIGFVVTPGHEGVFVRCMAGILNRLDQSRFRPEVFCPRSFAATMRPVLTPHVRMSDLPLRFDHAARCLRSAALDVIYYWEVGTDTTNHFLPFLRLAPVQCTGWGWPDTSGAPELDAHLTSEELASPDAQSGFSEQLFALPELPAWFERPPIPSQPKPRSHFGLADDATVYLCAQTLRKVHPEFDELIEGVLSADPDSVVVFVADKHRVPGNLLLTRWRDRLGDLSRRIKLVPRLAPEDYFHLVARADVALDTIYFGGTNTTYDALAAGVPVVTMPTSFVRGRYSAALCRRAGIAEWCVASSTGDYVDKAVRLGTDRTLRAQTADVIGGAGQIFESPAAVSQLEDVFAILSRSRAEQR